MISFRIAGRKNRLAVVLAWLAAWAGPVYAQPAVSSPLTNVIRILEIQGTVEIARAGALTWDPAYTNQVLHSGDRGRTRERSQVLLHLRDLSLVRYGERSEFTLQAPPPASKESVVVNFLRGLGYYFSRERPGQARFNSRSASAAVRGTEFVIEVDDNDRMGVTLLDGEVELSNNLGSTNLVSGEQGVAEPGRPPSKTAVLDARNVIQWLLYYPAVLDLRDLPLTPDERQILSESLAAYRSGDLLVALARYPAARQPQSDAERIYYAALLLSVGQVTQAKVVLDALPVADPSERLARLANALRTLMAAVQRRENPPTLKPQLPTEFLASSYYEQARATGDGALKRALTLARQAAAHSPEFGFAWERVAELEFSFGHNGSALEALTKSLALAPRNAQALALKGFLLAAQNKTRDAVDWFNKAIAVDAALANAWLGRGLCRIRGGDAGGGRDDLLIAAALEPQRALLRSYLGKAFSNAGDDPHAEKELARARQLDPNDPTSWFYSALLNDQRNRINEAVGDLEKSEELSENRRVYRSRLMLEQDRAVRGANLALIYQDAGMFEVSVREASRAVQSDYANFSTHLFLANSYNALRDVSSFNLRFETAAVSEYLVSYLLAPAGALTLSQNVSQQEYSKLFEHDRIGFASSTAYNSSGSWGQNSTLYGNSGNFGYAMDANYLLAPGQLPNNDVEIRYFSLQLKQDITPQDSLYLQSVYSDTDSGDLNLASANPAVRINERQDPVLLTGYHHEWGQGVHTLLLAGRVPDTLRVTDPALQVPLGIAPGGQFLPIFSPQFVAVDSTYRSEVELYTVEGQQIFRQERHGLILGGRYQTGDFDTQSRQIAPGLASPRFPGGVLSDQHFADDFRRLSFYGYHDWQIFSPLLLTVGLSHDRLDYPQHFRNPPINNNEETRQRWSPKAGLIWTVDDKTTVRGAFTRSLSGVAFDQSFRLEPTQVGGFNQSFRSLIPEAVVGATAAATFETWSAGIDRRFGTRTYIGLEAELLKSDLKQPIGAYALDLFPPLFDLHEQFDYEERNLTLTFNQLLSEEWALGLRDRLSDVELDDRFQEIPFPAFPGAFKHSEATLNQLNLFALYTHPSGFFSRAEALWYVQSSRGAAAAFRTEDFWQFNAFVGYRFPRRWAEVVVGVANLTDRNYALNPLNLFNTLPNQRTLVANLRFNF